MNNPFVVLILLICLFVSHAAAEEIPCEYELPVQTLEGHLEYNDIQEQPEEIYLDLETKKNINFTPPKTYTSDTSNYGKNINLTVFDSSRLEAASKFSTQEYNISPTSRSLYRRNGKFTFGTAYDSYLDTAEINYETSLFTKYDTKKFAVTTMFAKNTGNDYSKYNDKVYIIPELKLTKRLSILNSFRSDPEGISTKNELILKYTPKLKNNYNDLSFEVGAAQSYTNNEYTKSSIRFSTKFKL